MAPKYLFSNGCNLLGYSKRLMVSCAYYSDCLTIPASLAVRARAQRSSGRRCGWRIQVKQEEI
jgi:hypothetical protein